MNDAKKEFHDKANAAREQAKILEREATQHESETMRDRDLAEAKIQRDIATTLDNCGNAIKP